MGVPHKLKSNVVEFIIKQKQASPSLSCRQLVDVVQQQFHIDLSKSSINAILKSAALSSPVGRREGGGDGNTSFKIPQHKKDLLFSVFKPGIQQPDQRREEKRLPGDTDIGGQAIFKKKSEDSFAAPRVSEEKLYDGMGCVFLKAAEWDISEKPIWGKLLAEYFPDVETSFLDSVGDVLLFLKPFGIPGPESLPLYKQQGLWRINGMEQAIPVEKILNVFKRASLIKNLSTKLSLEMQNLLAEVSTVKLSLENGKEVVWDAHFFSPLPSGCPIASSLLFRKASTVITNQILTNSEPLILGSTRFRDPDASEEGRELFSDFRSLWLALENIRGHRLQKVALCDSSNSEAVCFDIIPSKKRTFIAGVWPWQNEFQYFLNLSPQREAEQLLNLESGLQLLVHQKDSNIALEGINEGVYPIRVFCLQRVSENEPFLILISNAQGLEFNVQNIVNSYVSRWPNLDESFSLIPSGKAQTLIEAFDLANHSNINACASAHTDFQSAVDMVLAACESYSKRHFFSVPSNEYETYCSPDIYKANGLINTKKRILSFDVFAESIKENRLEIAAKRVNQNNIIINNYKLIINIK